MAWQPGAAAGGLAGGLSGGLAEAWAGEWALEWRAAARTAANDSNSDFAAGYGLAALRWRGQLRLGTADTLELLARVDNLFNRAYIGSVIVNDGNARYFEPGLPRNGLLSARWLHRW